MLSTHSPLFINPFEDNTTIVRLSRSGNNPTPKKYRSETIEFSEDEKEEVALLNTFDQNLSEMFFGQYPIIIEGDTEFASFQKVMNLELEKYPLASRPVFIRARGKYTIIPIIKMLSHFKVDFSVLHDSDYPKTKSGSGNSAWTANEKILEAIEAAREGAIKVKHRISFYTFEVETGEVQIDEEGNVILPSTKNKPFEMYSRIGKEKQLKDFVEAILDDLMSDESSDMPFKEKLPLVFEKWVNSKQIKDSRFLLN